MKTLIHLSDLHFGRIHAPALDSLQRFLLEQDKIFDLIIVTGDWTQRARRSQYREARSFLEKVRTPVLSVPGNHDIPLYNLPLRLLNPFRRYREFIQPVTKSIYNSEDVVAVGISTVNSRSVYHGILRDSEIERACAAFAEAPPAALRVLASHHPLFAAAGTQDIRPARLLQEVWTLQPNIVLSGHCHSQNVEMIEGPRRQKILQVSAGSTTSNRLRGEANSFHILKIEDRRARIETYFLAPDGFLVEENIEEFEFS